VGVTNPLGAFDDDITLLHNRDDGMGNTNNMQGTSGANLGVLANGTPIGTVFDDFASRSIYDMLDGATAPFIGHFRDDLSKAPGPGVLNTFVAKNLKPGDLTRTWVLVIGDYSMETPAPTQQVVNWSLNFTFGLVPSPFPTGLVFG